MINETNLIIFLLWLLSAITDYSQFCYLWQLKEYRIDRFKDFLSSRQGKEFWLQYPLFWRSIIALTMFFWPINEVVLVKQIIIAVYSLDVLNTLKKVFDKKFHRPRFTPKSLGIIGVALFIEGMLLLWTYDWTILFLLLILRFPIISIVVGVFSYPTKVYKTVRINAARKKLALYPDMKVIGITGSFGKSSTKEFLYHVLSEKYRVIKTPKNINTEIGIAQFILTTDFSNCRYFVVEMGAYNQGEIALICSMVKPTYGILTTIAEEHLALFGSIENIQKAKYELLHALPSTGYAITNGDNVYCTKDLATIKSPHALFGIDEVEHLGALITGVMQEREGIRFSIKVQGTEVHFFAPILGEHNVLNIAAALLMAQHLGMSILEIQSRITTLTAEHGVIKTYQYGKAIIVDDTYNSNPTGFRAALAVMTTFPSSKKRIVITRGMLELGSLSDQKHEEIGGEIAFSADELIIISPDSADAMERGIVKKYGITVQRIFEPDMLLTYIKEKKDTDTVILLENRMPYNVAEEIKQFATYVSHT